MSNFMTEPSETTASRYPHLPDGTPHPVYLSQIECAWRTARDHLIWAAHAGREAQQRWDNAATAERAAHRRMRNVFEAVGKPLPEAESND